MRSCRRLIRHRYVEAVLVQGHGDDVVLSSHGFRDEIQRPLFGTRLAEIGDVHPVELGAGPISSCSSRIRMLTRTSPKSAPEGGSDVARARSGLRSRDAAAAAPSGAEGWSAR